jgi:hypothetical protein
MAGARSAEALGRIMEEARDRYGPQPASIDNLADYALIRLLADRVGVESIDREGQIVVLKFRPDARIDATWLFRIVQERSDVQLAPPATLKLDLRTGSAVQARKRGSAAAGPKKGGTEASWWTRRATTGEVAPGFTKEEILRPVPEDPRAEGGVFSRVSGLLRDLSEGARVR